MYTRDNRGRIFFYLRVHGSNTNLVISLTLPVCFYTLHSIHLSTAKIMLKSLYSSQFILMRMIKICNYRQNVFIDRNCGRIHCRGDIWEWVLHLIMTYNHLIEHQIDFRIKLCKSLTSVLIQSIIHMDSGVTLFRGDWGAI